MDTDRATEDVAGLGLLTDPARRSLYDFVAEQRSAVTREEAAAATGISRYLAAYHLDKLADAGLLDVSYARKAGRTGPGSGRPAKQYTRSARELAVSFPPRNYSLLAHILADAADDAASADEAAGANIAGAPNPVRLSLAHAAEHAGRRLGEQAADLTTALTAAGYEPAETDTGTVILNNCPFHAIVEDHTDLVCSLNHAVIRGTLTGTGDDPDRAELDPCDGRCCVTIAPGSHH